MIAMGDGAAYEKPATNGREFWKVEEGERVVAIHLSKKATGRDHHVLPVHPRGGGSDRCACILRRSRNGRDQLRFRSME
jgi:hypothetical protein